MFMVKFSQVSHGFILVSMFIRDFAAADAQAILQQSRKTGLARTWYSSGLPEMVIGGRVGPSL